MKDNIWKAAGALIVPLLIHSAMTCLVQLLFDSFGADVPALAVTAADGLCIPVFAQMLRRDGYLDQQYKQSDKTDHSGRWQHLFRALCLIAGAACSFLGGWIMQHTGIYNTFSNAAQEDLYSAPLWLQLAGLCFVVPLAEELLYRGLIFSRLRRLCPEWAAALGTALLFAAGHGNVIQALYAFPMALLLSLCAHFGEISCAVAFHIGANLWTVCFNRIIAML